LSKIAYSFYEVVLRCLDDQMVVVIHQTITMTQPLVAMDHIFQKTEKENPIAVVCVDYLLGVAA